MAIEIERKFLVTNPNWKKDATSKLYQQGYLCSGDGPTVRVRIAGEKSYVTIKGKHKGISRLEFEYDIPMQEARVLLAEVCRQPIIEKRRYTKIIDGFIWEIDEFLGDNDGLILAEIELQEEQQEFPKPDWLGKDVSALHRYYNASLCHYPFKDWSEREKHP